MQTKPVYLTEGHHERFKDRSVVDTYHHRLPYPPAVFDLLAGLSIDAPDSLLDTGTGTGDIARALVSRMNRVDAVDFSEAMIKRGQSLPGGDNPNLRWIHGRIEEVELFPPYSLITAADSLHWMNWETVLPHFRDMLTPHGVLAIITRGERAAPWQDGLTALISRYSTIQNYEPFDMVALLEKRGLLHKLGEQTTEPVIAMQSIDDYTASFHSRASLSLENMSPDSAAAFDAGLRNLVLPWSEAGMLTLQTEAHILWCRPLYGEPK